MPDDVTKNPFSRLFPQESLAREYADVTRNALNHEFETQSRKGEKDLFEELTYLLLRAVWYVEYLKRHGHAQFLKPYSVSMPWYQYYLIDVITVLTVTSLIFFVSFFCCCRFLCRKCCFKKIKTE